MDATPLQLTQPAADSTWAPEQKPSNARDAAQQFEALLLAQLLQSARQGDDGWLGSGGDSASDTATSFAEQQLALMLARQGGFGLANLIAHGLESRESGS